MRILRANLRELILFGVLILLLITMGLSSENFLSSANLLDDMPRHLAEKGLLALGMTLVIMTGGIDLSIGSLMALCCIIFGYSWKIWGLGFAPALCLSLLTGLIGGSLNGLFVSRWNLPALVVTLATMALFRGCAMFISKAQPVSSFEEAFGFIGQGYIGTVPTQLVIWLVVLGLFFMCVSMSPLGRWTTAVGNNIIAARFAALPVNKIKMLVYVITGCLCAFAAIIFTSRVATAKADAGLGIELEVITAVVLGGTSITGGRGTILGTFLGVVILGTLRNGMNLAGVASLWQEVLVGALLICATVFNQQVTEKLTK